MPAGSFEWSDLKNVRCLWQSLAESNQGASVSISFVGQMQNTRSTRAMQPFAYLVFIILINAPMEFKRVTICALPDHASVTVITGQEKAKNSSND